MELVDHVTQYFPLFKDKVVIDIGCRTGIITERIAEHAKKIYGIEKNINWIREPLRDNLEYINLPIGEFLKKDYKFNAAYASRVLYYLTIEEIRLIETELFPKCDLIMFISREDKIESKINDYSFSKWQNIDNWLQENKYKTEIKDKGFKWTTVIGRK